MRKTVVALLFSTLLVGCAELNSVKKQIVPANFSEADLLGKKWLCKSSYDQWTLITEEYYQFYPNGTIVNTGKLVATLKGHRFAYNVKVNGVWAIDGWYLAQGVKSYQFNRNFSAEAKKARAKDPELKALEAKVFELLKDQLEQSKRTPARREIEVLTPTELTTRVGSSYEICGRVDI